MPYNYPEGACWEKNVFHIIFHYHGLMGLRRDQDISQTEIIEVRSSSSQPIFSRSCKTAAAADPQHRRSFQLRGQGGRDLSPARRLLYITPRAAVRVMRDGRSFRRDHCTKFRAMCAFEHTKNWKYFSLGNKILHSNWINSSNECFGLLWTAKLFDLIIIK